MKTNAELLVGLRGQSGSSAMIQFFVSVAVAFGISSVLVVSVVQKSREIGILRAMGASRRAVHDDLPRPGRGRGAGRLAARLRARDVGGARRSSPGRGSSTSGSAGSCTRPRSRGRRRSGSSRRSRRRSAPRTSSRSRRSGTADERGSRPRPRGVGRAQVLRRRDRDRDRDPPRDRPGARRRRDRRAHGAVGRRQEHVSQRHGPARAADRRAHPDRRARRPGRSTRRG